MHKPAHPGEILWELYLKPRGISIKNAAIKLGISPAELSAFVGGRRAVTSELAGLLGAAFSTKPEFWINLQRQYDTGGTA